MYYKEKAKEILLALSKAICGEDDPGEFVEDPYIKVVSNILSNTIHEKIEGKTRQEQIENLANIFMKREICNPKIDYYNDLAAYALYLSDEAYSDGYEKGREEILSEQEGKASYEIDTILRKIRHDLCDFIYYKYKDK